MKEYLTKNSSGNYQLVNHRFSEDDIEVPEGAEVATASGLAIYFWKPSENKTFIDNVGWSECDTKSMCTLDSYLEHADVSIIWEREQDEPFLTPETTLNDQYAEIEQVRKATKVESGADSNHAADAASYALFGFKQPDPLPFIDDNPLDVESVLNERGSRYGDFSDVSDTTMQLMSIVESAANYEHLEPYQKTALFMIFNKIARAVNGDPKYLDNYTDIAGYATLVIQELSRDAD